jgi:hypothetical protein
LRPNKSHCEQHKICRKQLPALDTDKKQESSDQREIYLQMTCCAEQPDDNYRSNQNKSSQAYGSGILSITVQAGYQERQQRKNTVEHVNDYQTAGVVDRVEHQMPECGAGSNKCAELVIRCRLVISGFAVTMPIEARRSSQRGIDRVCFASPRISSLSRVIITNLKSRCKL